MRRTFVLLRCLLGALLLSALPVFADPPAEPEQPADDQAPQQPADPVAQAIEQVNAQDNGITINRQAMTIDIQASVCLRSAEFLEMFMCTRDTREHESILATDATPSTIHFALLLLGQEPGSTLTYDANFDPPRLVPPTGPEVQIFIVREIGGLEQETPANRWIVDNKTHEIMEGNTWLFAGSQFAQYQGNEIYYADINGSAISLVNFGDDLLTLPNELTLDNASHDMVWAPRTQFIPEVGTAVVVRLRVQPAEADADAPEQDRDPGQPPPQDPGQAPEPGGAPQPSGDQG